MRRQTHTHAIAFTAGALASALGAFLVPSAGDLIVAAIGAAVFLWSE